jgi:hypothetical protein
MLGVSSHPVTRDSASRAAHSKRDRRCTAGPGRDKQAKKGLGSRTLVGWAWRTHYAVLVRAAHSSVGVGNVDTLASCANRPTRQTFNRARPQVAQPEALRHKTCSSCWKREPGWQRYQRLKQISLYRCAPSWPIPGAAAPGLVVYRSPAVFTPSAFPVSTHRIFRASRSSG